MQSQYYAKANIMQSQYYAKANNIMQKPVIFA